MLKERFGKGEVIIETLYLQLQHMPTATNRISDIKSTYENIEKILRQLESQREDINNQFSIQVLIKLKESKGLQDPWTVTVLRRSLKRYVTMHTVIMILMQSLEMSMLLATEDLTTLL